MKHSCRVSSFCTNHDGVHGIKKGIRIGYRVTALIREEIPQGIQWVAICFESLPAQVESVSFVGHNRYGVYFGGYSPKSPEQVKGEQFLCHYVVLIIALHALSPLPIKHRYLQ
jgi:hypothetical protein